MNTQLVTRSCYIYDVRSKHYPTYSKDLAMCDHSTDCSWIWGLIVFILIIVIILILMYVLMYSSCCEERAVRTGANVFLMLLAVAILLIMMIIFGICALKNVE